MENETIPMKIQGYSPDEIIIDDDYTFEECPTCHEQTVFVQGRCRTCINCFWSSCSL